MNYERDFDLLGDAESDEEEEEEEMIIPPQIEKFIQEERNAWVQTLMEQDQVYYHCLPPSGHTKTMQMSS